LLSKYSVLLVQIFNGLQLALVHPSCDGDQDELEGIQHSRHLVATPLSPQPAPETIQRRFKEIQFPVHAGIIKFSLRLYF
jgi:hypothetical protein